MTEMLTRTTLEHHGYSYKNKLFYKSQCFHHLYDIYILCFNFHHSHIILTDVAESAFMQALEYILPIYYLINLFLHVFFYSDLVNLFFFMLP